jgi:hypothetical protein
LVGLFLSSLAVVVSFGSQRQGGENSIPAQVGHFRTMDLRALVGVLQPNLARNPLVAFMGQGRNQIGTVPVAVLSGLENRKPLLADRFLDGLQHVSKIRVLVAVGPATFFAAFHLGPLVLYDRFDFAAGLGAGGNELADAEGAVTVHDPAGCGESRCGFGLDHGVGHG